jgi:hypothetical protein
MTSIIIVERLGELKSLTVKQFAEGELYKKAGFKVADGFDCQTTWTCMIYGETYIVSLYAKTKGRAGQENKYDFPPPVDSIPLMYGNTVLIRWSSLDKKEAKSITVDEWLKVYETLFGGFEDLDDSAEADAADLARLPTPELDELGQLIPMTKNGYKKDGFVVSDGDSDNSYVTEEEEEEEEVVVAPTKKPTKSSKKVKKEEVVSKKSKKSVKKETMVVAPVLETPVLEPNKIITGELQEEEYFA